jgi:hypothetical protein
MQPVAATNDSIKVHKLVALVSGRSVTNGRYYGLL